MATNFAPDLQVTLVDGTEYPVVNLFGDVLAWERWAVKHGLDTSSYGMTMFAFYAWRGAQKAGVCPGDEPLDVFADKIANIDPVEADPVDPTRQAPGDD